MSCGTLSSVYFAHQRHVAVPSLQNPKLRPAIARCHLADRIALFQNTDEIRMKPE